MSLDVIGIAAYRSFAERFFREAGRGFSAEAFDALYRRFDGVTWYLQSVLNRIWGEGGALESAKDVDVAVESLVRTALPGLEERDLVYRSSDGYMVYDYLFAEYLRSSLRFSI